jgi:hypothetical protein
VPVPRRSPDAALRVSSWIAPVTAIRSDLEQLAGRSGAGAIGLPAMLVPLSRSDRPFDSRPAETADSERASRLIWHDHASAALPLVGP